MANVTRLSECVVPEDLGGGDGDLLLLLRTVKGGNHVPSPPL